MRHDVYDRLRRHALITLEHAHSPRGFTAGTTHFNDLWARDALYASLGAKGTSYEHIGLETLKTLRAHQHESGQIPLRVGRLSMVRNLLGLKGPSGALYGNDKTKDPALDPNTLFIIVACEYKCKSTWHESIRKALAWLEQFEENDLLVEGSYASWDDALKKNAASVYNNVLYAHALHLAGKRLEDSSFTKRAARVKKAVNTVLWNGSFYDAWQGRKVMDVPGNLLAVLFDVADNSQRNTLLSTLDAFKQKSSDVLAKTNYPSYPRKDVYYPFYLVGMADYHNSGPYWSWITALEILARKHAKQKDYAQNLAEELLEWIQISGGIYEIYELFGKPLKRLFYSSEKNFAWTAGLLLVNKK